MGQIIGGKVLPELFIELIAENLHNAWPPCGTGGKKKNNCGGRAKRKGERVQTKHTYKRSRETGQVLEGREAKTKQGPCREKNSVCRPGDFGHNQSCAEPPEVGNVIQGQRE